VLRRHRRKIGSIRYEPAKLYLHSWSGSCNVTWIIFSSVSHGCGGKRYELSPAIPNWTGVSVSCLPPRGIGETSALQILGELAVLPDTLDARQWVAFAGLDPLRFSSGTSVEKKPRISRGGSRHLRRGLYMPAVVAIRHEPHLRAFYQRLRARGKAPLQAIVAVMRKLLHAFFAMFRSDHAYDGSRLCRTDLASGPVALCPA
jgi:Transposase IS116/IS110/IS902 family